MLSINAIEAIEGDSADELEYYAALQESINRGGNWSLQGAYGRAMMDAIERGRCMLGPQGARDYWGNYIPSRDEVQEGTKGSYEFVVDRAGQEWADHFAKID